MTDKLLTFAWDLRARFKAAGDKLKAESDKLRAESDKLRAESDKLRAESADLKATGDRLWVEAVTAARGNITIEWTPTGCRLETGEEFTG